MSLDHFSRIAVVGATGAVGREAIDLLAQRGVPAHRIAALASQRSAGARTPYRGGELVVQALTHEALGACNGALFCASADIAREFAPAAAAAGTVVVDNSSAFRADPLVPLVVPEINGHLIKGARLIANPNCSTIIMLLPLTPLRERFGVASIVISTYQAVSGAGLEALEELRTQTRERVNNEPITPRVFSEPIAFNLFPHESALDPATGLSGEESKMITESRRIWDDPALAVFPTCVRVPVERAHSQSIIVELKQHAKLDEVRNALHGAPGITVMDPRDHHAFPTPLKASNRNEVLVGRVRADPSGASNRFALWVCGDQLRKGAALNAIQILEKWEP